MAIFVTPYPRKSNGLLDGATDLIGGDPLQEPVMIDLWSDASGHIIIGPENGGGIVTWIRCVWDADTKFRYDAFMAETNPSNATNYMGAGLANIQRATLARKPVKFLPVSDESVVLYCKCKRWPIGAQRLRLFKPLRKLQFDVTVTGQELFRQLPVLSNERPQPVE